MSARDHAPNTEAASRDHARLTTAGAPDTLCVGQLTGDLLCPICGEPLEILKVGTEGYCATCTSTLDIAL